VGTFSQKLFFVAEEQKSFRLSWQGIFLILILSNIKSNMDQNDHSLQAKFPSFSTDLDLVG
jgi:hypothetical protein